MKKAACIIIAVMFMVTGCAEPGEKIINLPLVSALTEKEVIDYYKKAMAFDTIVTKNVVEHKVTYDEMALEGTTKNKLLEMVSQIEEILKLNEYTEIDGTTGEYTGNIISKETFGYIKSFLNDKKIYNGTVMSVTEALGHYFVNVEYEIGAANVGMYRESAIYLGLHGLMYRDPDGTDLLDAPMVKTAVKKMNEYYESQKSPYRLAFDESSGLLYLTENGVKVEFGEASIVPTEGVDDVDFSQTELGRTEEAIGTGGNSSDTAENTGADKEEAGKDGDGTGEVAATEEGAGTGENGVNIEANAEETIKRKLYDLSKLPANIDSNAEPFIDVASFNKVAGVSMKQSAYLPKLSEIFQWGENNQDIAGVGLYKDAEGGIEKFGYSRESLDGKVTLRYVFKQDLLDINKIKGINIYPVDYDVFSGVSAEFSSTTVPEFVLEQLTMLIDRMDRAVVNNDLPALVGGSIFNKIGYGVKRAYEDQFVNVTRQISTIRRILSRDVESGSYLLEIETVRQEGQKGADTYGTFRDRYIVVVEQNGTEFVITDFILALRQMTEEPSIDPDNVVAKRLVAIGLAGEVPNEAKKACGLLIQELYKACNDKKLRGPYVDSNGVEVVKGMYDCFNSDVELLTTSKNEYLNASLREQLVKFGIDVPSKISGVVTTWVGGSDKQAEFFAEEVIEYSGKSEIAYMQTYYLLTSVNDVWVIDDRNMVEVKQLNGEEADIVKSRILG